jgi:WD40 repeat protein
MPTNTYSCDEASNPTGDPILGKLLDGRYQIINRLGRGGFAKTYIARDTRRPGHPQCVVKQLKPLVSGGSNDSENARRLFDREAETLEKLGRHDKIPHLLAHFEEDQEFYLVQEFIEGHLLSAEFKQGDRWTEDQVIQLLLEISSILEFVHTQRVIHRDIKPDNLIRRQSDHRLVLIDFGTVKLLQADPSQSPEQAPTTIAITSQGYTPREQIRGKPHLDSDIYALGMIGIQALTGTHPKYFEEGLTVTEILQSRQVQVSAGLVTVLTTMTHFHWAKRYQNATEVREALQKLSSQRSEAIAISSKPSFTATADPEYTPTQIVSPPPSIQQQTSVSTPKSSPADEALPANLRAEKASSFTQTTTTTHFSQAEQTLGKRRWVDNLRTIPTSLTPKTISLLIGMGMISAGIVLLVGFFAGTRIPSGPRESLSHIVSAEFLLETLQGQSPARSVAFSPDGQTLVSASANDVIEIWDLQTGQPIQTLSNHVSWVSTVAVSPDGQTLASGSIDTKINLWNLNTGELIHSLRGHVWQVLSVTFSPDGQMVVSSSEDNTIKIWNVRTGELLNTLSGYQGAISSVDISLDGSVLVGGSADNTIKIWNVYTGKLLQTLKGHADEVHSIAISPNSAILVSGSADHTVKIWNLYTGELLHTLTEHGEAVRSVAISPNGEIIASADANGIVNVWHLYTGERLRTFRDRSGEIYSIAISVDGKMLASGGSDGTIKLWQMP